MPRTSVRVEFDRNYQRAVLTVTAPKWGRAAELVAEQQRRTIPVSRDGSHGRPPGYARSRIDVRPGADTTGPYLDVGSDATTPDGVSYPAILDAGSRPHVIESHGDYPLRSADGRVFGKRVNHPGTQPTYWCRGSIAVLAGRTL